MASCTRAVSTGWRRSSTRHCRSIFPTKRSARLVRSPTTVSVAALGGGNKPVEFLPNRGQQLGEVDKVIAGKPDERIHDAQSRQCQSDSASLNDSWNEIEHSYTTRLGVTTMAGRRSPSRRPFSRVAP